MKTFVVRHGLTNYTQGEVPIEDANDILPEAKPILRDSAAEIVRMYGVRKLKIKTSPLGRAGASAKILHKKFSSLDVAVDEIEIEPNLVEIKGLNYPVLLALAEGGAPEIDGVIYPIDKEVSNPNSLPFSSFFRRDIIHASGYLDKFHPEVARVAGQIEKASQARARLQSVIEKSDSDTVLVTHDGVTSIDYARLNPLPDAFLDRGKFMTFDKRRSVWIPVYTNSR